MVNQHLLAWPDLTLDHSFNQMDSQTKSAYNLLIIGPRELGW